MASKKYIVVKPKSKRQRKLNAKINVADGYMLVSRKKSFTLEETDVSRIRVINKKFIHNLVKKKVDNRFRRLMNQIVTLLITEDETGEGTLLVLDQIERFRQEIKNKYKIYLTKKELEEMAKQLVHMQKEAKMKMLVISRQNIFDMPEKDTPTVGRSR